MDSVTSMPVSAGIQLGAAALQVLAEDHAVDLIHIKGPAVDDSLLEVGPGAHTDTETDTGAAGGRPVPRSSVDVDVLVRPGHVERLFAAMRDNGWVLMYGFTDGSAFEHAATWMREGVAAADVHRAFPGIGAEPEAAFDRLFRDGHRMPLAGYPCTVPSVTAQRLILILHAVRGGDLAGSDIRRAWTEASQDERDQVDLLAADLGAQVALAAATGRLERYRGSREYALWRALSTGERSRRTLWWARVRAQPGLPAALRTAVRLVAPKSGRLRHSVGHEPTPREVAGAWAGQARLVLAELADGLRRWAAARR